MDFFIFFGNFVDFFIFFEIFLFFWEFVDFFIFLVTSVVLFNIGPVTPNRINGLFDSVTKPRQIPRNPAYGSTEISVKKQRQQCKLKLCDCATIQCHLEKRVVINNL